MRCVVLSNFVTNNNKNQKGIRKSEGIIIHFFVFYDTINCVIMQMISSMIS